MIRPMLFAACALLAHGALAQQDKVERGRDLYAQCCETCHGPQVASEEIA
jgi:mono/diheme cytochrome c family protein